jgi:hypothetical protein
MGRNDFSECLHLRAIQIKVRINELNRQLKKTEERNTGYWTLLRQVSSNLMKHYSGVPRI